MKKLGPFRALPARNAKRNLERRESIQDCRDRRIKIIYCAPLDGGRETGTVLAGSDKGRRDGLSSASEARRI